ncbi:MAG: hypothetical protein CVU56_28845 [Deltaproteobacteria bacterium HGW-Deltaproteobacteria-14]|nr:MAG: hypothetical protein CVU56_28845 [Deltaproteobacteria bacterium HGW-Deltaproteobacteria-14]
MEFVLFGLVAVAVVLAVGSHQSQAWIQAMTALARQHEGLEVVRGGVFKSASVTGTVDDVPVTVDTFTRSHGKSSTTYSRVAVEIELPAALRVGREGFGTSLTKVFMGDDIEVGDHDFDAALTLRGAEPATVVAHLDAATRQALRSAIEVHRAELDAGTLKLVVVGRAKLPVLEGLIDAGLDVARAARATSGSVAERLERIAFDDPVPGVQRRAFELLMSRVNRGGAERIARRALETGDPAMAVLAAEVLRDEAAVAALHAVVASSRAPNGALARALELLAELGRPPAEPAVQPLTEALDEAVRASAARCLGAIGGAAAQARLVELLGDEPTIGVAAADALGRCGDLATVEPLLARTKGVFGSSELKRAAGAAIKAIQARGAGSAGQLSLVEHDGGGGLALVAEGDPEVVP